MQETPFIKKIQDYNVSFFHSCVLSNHPDDAFHWKYLEKTSTFSFLLNLLMLRLKVSIYLCPSSEA